MKSKILFTTSLLLFLCGVGPGWGQSVTWQSVGTIPLVDLLYGNIFGGLNGTIFLSEGYRSDDLGNSWTPISIAPRDVVIAPGGVLLFAVEDGVLKSTDNGETFEQLSGDIQGKSIDNIIIANSSVWFVRSGRKYFRSDDAGMTWTLKGEFPTDYLMGPGAVNAQTLFCAAEFPTEFGSGDEANDSTGVYRSTDAGATWDQTTFSPEFITQGKLMVLRSFHVGSNGTLLVGIQGLEGVGGVYRSVDGGESWSSTTLQDVVTRIIRAPEGTWFATAANSGAYRSTDDGRTWSSINAGLSDPRIFPLALNSDGILFTADVFSNFYRTKQPVVSVSSTPNEESSLGTVLLNPNITDDAVTLTIHSAKGGIARVHLLDLLGREVQRLIERTYGKGENLLELDLQKIPTGRYYVQVELGGEMKVLPVVLIR